MHLHSATQAILLSICFLSQSLPTRAQSKPPPHPTAMDEELGEAQGLMPTPSSPPKGPQATSVINSETPLWRWRLYGLLDWRLVERTTPRQSKSQDSGANAEAGLSLDGPLGNQTTGFFAARIKSQADEKERIQGVHFDQGGLRWRPRDHFVFVIGKERNRRAPGMIIAPSDFIHTNQSLPGMQEELSGVWLGRIALQKEDYSVDFVALAFGHENTQGMPTDDSKINGFVVRLFRRGIWSGFDLGLDFGQVDNQNRLGFFAQTIFAQVWKAYYEAGIRQVKDQEHGYGQLLGMSYEGISDVSIRAEYNEKNQHFDLALPLLQDDRLLITSLQARELNDIFNANYSFLRSLESKIFAHIIRFEWLADDHQILGASGIQIYPERPFKNQFTIDWRYNF